MTQTDASGPVARLSHRARLTIFLVVCVVALSATAVSVIHGRDAAASRTAAPASSVEPESLTTRPALLFRSTALDRNFGRLEVLPLADPKGPRQLTALKCDRVDFEGGRGVCFSSPRAGLFATATATIFDTEFRPLRSVALTGYPSRVRVSPDGRYAATTSFVSGDSYATIGFSTRTSILDLQAGKLLFDLEKLVVRRNGTVFQAADFNFWGVTFAKDSRVFYATLGTGGHTYLIQGDVTTRQAVVLRADVECPALSPDNLRIAFKQRLPGPVVTWRLSVLDLASGTTHPLAETRNVDDQAEWLDNDTVIYGIPSKTTNVASSSAGAAGAPVLGGGASIQTSTWSVPADGSGRPKELLPGSWSTVVVRHPLPPRRPHGSGPPADRPSRYRTPVDVLPPDQRYSTLAAGGRRRRVSSTYRAWVAMSSYGKLS